MIIANYQSQNTFNADDTGPLDLLWWEGQQGEVYSAVLLQHRWFGHAQAMDRREVQKFPPFKEPQVAPMSLSAQHVREVPHLPRFADGVSVGKCCSSSIIAQLNQNVQNL